MSICKVLFLLFRGLFVSRSDLILENLALRRQLTVRFRILYCFIVLHHHRRRIVHFNVTANPTAQWTSQQITEALPYDSAPKYLIRDRDKIFGNAFVKRVRNSMQPDSQSSLLKPIIFVIQHYKLLKEHYETLALLARM